MQGFDHLSHLQEFRLRTARAERLATLRASLGPTPEPVRIRPFARRVAPLQATIEVAHPAASAPVSINGPLKAA